MLLGNKQKVKTKTYQCWLDMKQRCYNKNNQRYYTHGERGITVCETWLNSYQSFYKDMGEKPKGYSIDRVNNDGNYEPSNCRWATSKEQAENRRTNVNITYNNITKTLSQWAASLNITQASFTKRLSKFSLEKAMSITRYDNPKVTKEIKEEMLRLYSIGNITQKDLANQFGLSRGVMYRWLANGN